MIKKIVWSSYNYALDYFDLNILKKANVLLIDDVLTSGATANACAQALLNAGAARVEVLTIARAVKENNGTF